MVRRKPFVAIAFLILLLTASGALHAASILGEWELVEQSYGEGTANQLDPDASPLRLSLFRSGSEIQGTLVVGESRAGESWPRLVSGDGRAVHVAEKRLSESEDRIITRYQVDPAPGDNLVLQVTESYRLDTDGNSMSGEVTIEFIRQGQGKGSYTLHRRFERRTP